SSGDGERRPRERSRPPGARPRPRRLPRPATGGEPALGPGPADPPDRGGRPAAAAQGRFRRGRHGDDGRAPPRLPDPRRPLHRPFPQRRARGGGGGGAQRRADPPPGPPVIVMKLGGSSLAAAPEIDRAVGIVRARLDRRPLVVVSAMARTTRALFALGEAAGRGDFDAADEQSAAIRAFHETEGSAVAAPEDLPLFEAALDRHFADLTAVLGEIEAAGEVTARLADAVVSFGELLSSEIFTLALQNAGVDAEWLDCREVLATSADFTRALPLYAETEERLRAAVAPIFARGGEPVVGGYVGSTLGGVTTTLGREGSDFSAAIFGSALGCEEIQIWTDVDGILSADPRLFPGARRVASLSFAEGLELARSGSKKPHPGTLEPASRKGVPIRILSSLEPEGAEERGTRIGCRAADGPALEATPAQPAIKSIACRCNAHLLRVHPLGGATLDDLRPGVLAA